jgi:hypothetical protein
MIHLRPYIQELNYRVNRELSVHGKKWMGSDTISGIVKLYES